MKLKIKELSKRIEMVLSLQGHGCGNVQDLDVQTSHLEDTPSEPLFTALCQQSDQSHPQQQRKQQRRQQRSLDCLHKVNTNLENLLRRCNSLNLELTSGEMKDCLSETLPSCALLTDVRTPRHQAKEQNCPSEAADTACRNCKLQQIEAFLPSPKISRTFSHVLRPRARSTVPDSAPLNAVVKGLLGMPAQAPGRQPRLTAEQVAAPDLEVSQVMVHEKDIGEVTACEKPRSQSPQCPRLSRFTSRELFSHACSMR